MSDFDNLSLEDILAEYSGSGKNPPNEKKNAVQNVSSAKKPKAAEVKKEAPKPVPAAEPAATAASEAAVIPPAKTGSDRGNKNRRGMPVTKEEIFKQRIFLFKQLVKRDFTGRYKRAALGVVWSLLSPLLSFAVQALVFTYILGRSRFYMSYLIIGNVVFHFFTDFTTSTMSAIASNGGIISKIKVPKSVFMLSKSVSCLINFGMTLIVMFVVTAIDGCTFHYTYASLIYPIITMTVMNLGVGYFLSVGYVFFRDTQYMYSIFTKLLMYFSAIFYYVDSFPQEFQHMFFLNPVYCFIFYFRSVIINHAIPNMTVHILCFAYAVLAVLLGYSFYKKKQNRFIYYY